MSFNARVYETFKGLLQSKKSGAVVCQSGEVKRLVFFEGGALVGCRSGLPEERLGEVMVREGRITGEQLGRAAEHIRTGRKMGQIMVELGYLKGGEIEGFVRLQILEVASRMLLEACDRVVFSDQIPVDAVTLAPVSVAEVAIHASRRLDDEDVMRYREKVLTDDFVLVRSDHPPTPAEKLDLSRDELAVLDRVDSLSTTGDILKSSSVSVAPEGTIRTLVGLVHAGLVDMAQMVAPEIVLEGDEPLEDVETKLARTFRQVQDQNHWGVLGLEPGADYSEIEKAYANLRDELARPEFAGLSGVDHREKLSFIQARLKDAFLTLSAQSQAVAYGKLVKKEREYETQREDWELPARDATPLPKDSAKAKKIFQQALKAFQDKDYWSAIQLSRAAIELNEVNDADHYHLLGAALAHNPRWRKDAEKHLKIAAQLSPWEPRYLISLAKFYHREGQGVRAQQLLEQVRAIDPGYPIPGLEEKRSKP